MGRKRIGVLAAIALSALLLSIGWQAMTDRAAGRPWPGEVPIPPRLSRALLVLTDPDLTQREAMLERTARGIRLALEHYATDHDGAYPSPENLVASLTRPGSHYLAGDQWPLNPWGTPARPIVYVPDRWPVGLPTLDQLCGARAGTVPWPEQGRDLGPGKMPGAEPPDERTYGSVWYAYDSALQLYALCAIGKTGDRATLILMTTNCGG